jgi:hypothetical protein
MVMPKIRLIATGDDIDPVAICGLIFFLSIIAFLVRKLYELEDSETQATSVSATTKELKKE